MSYSNMVVSSKSRWRLLLAVVAVLLAFAVGWLAAVRFRSPAQREAQARPPAQGPIFETVRSGDLADQVSGSGTITYTGVSALPVSELPANAVVTRQTAAAGTLLSAGAVASEVNGAPVFVFPGAFPFYRDLGPGLTGPDVRQLQAGLRAANLPVTENGSFGPDTRAAVSSLYQRAGYPAQDRLPLADLAVAASLPAALMSAPAVGAHPDPQQPLITLGRGTVVARIEVDSAAVVRMVVGQPAQLSIGSGGAEARATVLGIAENASGSGSGLSSVTLKPVTPLPPSRVGQRAVGIVTIRSVARGALLVPVRALATGADGRPKVLARRPGGDSAPVPVTVLGSLAGLAAVRPVAAGALAVGDLVEVG